MSIVSTYMMAEGGGGGGFMELLFPLAIVFLIFWFLVIRPASRERKRREASVRAVKKHDKVVTNAGIHGTVMSADDETVVLRVDDKNNVRIRFSRAAVWQVQPAGSGGGGGGGGDGDDHLRKGFGGGK